MKYYVTWENDVDADSAYDAAIKCQEMLKEPFTNWTFAVKSTDESSIYLINLEDDTTIIYDTNGK